MSRPIDPRLLRAAPALRRLLVQLGAVQVAAAVLVIAQAMLLADLVVAVFLDHRSAAAILGRLVALLGVGLGRAGLAGLQEYATAGASVRVRAELRRHVLAGVLRLGPAWASRQPSGRLATAAGPGLEALDGYLTRAVPALVSASIVPAVVIVCIGWADWQSAVVLLLIVPLVPLFMALVGLATRQRMQRQYTALSAMAGHFLDLVQGLTTLKIYGQAQRQVRTVRRGTEDYRRRTVATLRIAFLSGLVLDLIATLSVAVVAVDVGLRLAHGSLGLSTALVVLLLAPELFAPLRAVGAQYHATEDGRVASEAALDVLDEAASVPDRSVPLGCVPTGAITVQDVRVVHPGRDEPALDGVTLAVAPGEVVALQGRSGGGKSTLLAVLLGFVHPDAGEVRVAVRDADDMAWVPQRPRPTQPTVAAEIGLGDPQAPPERVAEAAARCRAPHPDTRLGEDGVGVSAGQRRRIALARALLRAEAVRSAGAVPVLLLDEPSEDLDPVTEQVVADVIAGLAGWATVLMVTHSADLARVAGRRVEIAQGRVVADSPQRPVRAPVSGSSTPARTDRRGTAGSPLSVVPGAALPLRRLLSMRAVAGRLGGAAAMAAAAGVAGLALTATSLWLICRAAQHPNVQALALAVVGVRTFALSRALLRYGERLTGHDAALRVLADLRARVFAALVPLAPSGVTGARRGDLLRRFVSDVDGVQEGLVRAVLPGIGAVTTGLAAVLLAGLLAPAAGLVLAGALLADAALLVIARPGPVSEVAARAAERDAGVVSLLDGIGELTAYGAAEHALHDVACADRRLSSAARLEARRSALTTAACGAVSAVAVPAVILAGTATSSMPRIAVGVLVACVLVGLDAVAPLPAAVTAWGRHRAGLQRVAAVLAEPAPMGEPDGPAEVPAGPVGLRGRRVRVAPAAGAAPVLDDALFDVAVGERVLLAGPSGSGKSTLLAAALRLLPLRAGRIGLADADRAELADLADLRAEDVPPLVAGSLQGDHVFDAALRDNLRVVRPDASDDDLDAVAARAGLADFVRTLPGGWSAPAGPDGAALSGGQRQRLLLARALLADPRVLVLDEPVAHLDDATADAVLADLLRATDGRTVLFSSHRAVPEADVDRHLLLDGGRLEHRTRPMIASGASSAS